jgi:serine/threonine protein kinase, bacterial
MAGKTEFMSKFSLLPRTLAALGFSLIGLAVVGAPSAQATAADVSTLAGSGAVGNVDGQGSAASFSGPGGVAVDPAGNVFVGDQGNNVVRKITPGGLVTTFAGSGAAGAADGLGNVATFEGPYAIAIDGANNLYVTDRGNFLIRKITPSGLVSTLAGSGAAGAADGQGVAASFRGPTGIVVDSSGNLFVADTDNASQSTIRKVTAGGFVSTFAGSGAIGYVDGVGTAAMFYLVSGLAIDSSDNLFVADTRNYRIRKITPAGLVSTFAGSGLVAHTNATGTAAAFNFPQGMAVDSANNVYVGDRFNYRVRKITPGAVVTDYAGSGSGGNVDGPAFSATFSDLVGMGADSAGNVYVADLGNNEIRKIESSLPLAGCTSPLAPCLFGVTATSSTSSSSTTLGGCPSAAFVCASTTTSTTTSTIPAATLPPVVVDTISCPGPTTIDVTGVPRCVPATTSTTQTTVPSSVVTTVPITTTIAAPAPPTTTPLGVSVVDANPDPVPTSDPLAYTGGAIAGPAVVGLSLVVVGFLLLRRKTLEDTL